jgi:cell division protein FtsL
MPKVRKTLMPSMRILVKPLALMLLCTGILSLVWIRTRVMEVRYEIGELEKSRTELLTEHKKLISQKNRLSSPARIAMRASRLGLTLPDRSNVYQVRYSTRVVRVKNGKHISGNNPNL